jgi:hypothetical protein
MESMIPIVAILTVFGTGIIITAIALFVAYRSRSMDHQERIAAIEKGIALPDLAKSVPANHRHAPLQRGIILLFIGMGLSVALFYTAGITVAVWGVFVAFIGLGNLVWWMISRKLDWGSGGGDGT